MPFFSLCCKRKYPSNPCNRGCPVSLEPGLQWPQSINCGVRVEYNVEKPTAVVAVTEVWERPVSLALRWPHSVSVWLNSRPEGIPSVAFFFCQSLCKQCWACILMDWDSCVCELFFPKWYLRSKCMHTSFDKSKIWLMENLQIGPIGCLGLKWMQHQYPAKRRWTVRVCRGKLSQLQKPTRPSHSMAIQCRDQADV